MSVEVTAPAALRLLALERVQEVAGRVPARSGCPWAPELRDALDGALRAGVPMAAVARAGGVGRNSIAAFARDLGVATLDRGQPGAEEPCGVVVWRHGVRHAVGADLRGEPAPMTARQALDMAARMAAWPGVERVAVVGTRWLVEVAERVPTEEESAAIAAAEVRRV